MRYIFDQFLAGVQVQDIIKILREMGITHRGKPFARNTVYRMLLNEKYTGVYRYNGEAFENIYPAIISKETYERAVQKSKVREYGRRSTEVVYLLRNKIKCGYCGRPISAETGTARSGEVKRYYKCLGRKHHNGCTKANPPKNYLEDIVVKTIIDELSKSKTIDRIVSALLDEQERQIAQNSILNVLIQEKKAVDKSAENMLRAIEQGVITEITVKRLKELEAKQKELEAQILIEQNKNTVRLSASDIREYYKEGLKREPKILINFLVKEIILFDDMIEIYFNSPTRTSPDKSGLFYLHKNCQRNKYRDATKIKASARHR